MLPSKAPLESSSIAGFRHALYQISGILATSLLVNSNRLVLRHIQIPGNYAALAFLHYLCTFIFTRATSRCASSGVLEKKYHWIWSLLISSLATLSVLASNFILHTSTVTFHQLSKLLALPVAALVDFFLLQKRRSLLELSGLGFVAYGAYIASVGDFTVNRIVILASVIHLTGYVSSAALVRHICKKYNLGTSQVLFLLAPWSAFASLVFLVFALSSAVGEISISISFLGLLSLLLNIGLAISVQWLSTWTAANCTTMLYAVVGQAKTAVTIILGNVISDSVTSIDACVGLCICIVAALMLATIEAFQHERGNALASKLTAGSLVITVCLFLLSIIGSPGAMQVQKIWRAQTEPLVKVYAPTWAGWIPFTFILYGSSVYSNGGGHFHRGTHGHGRHYNGTHSTTGSSGSTFTVSQSGSDAYLTWAMDDVGRDYTIVSVQLNFYMGIRR